jgi:hypothetical protein
MKKAALQGVVPGFVVPEFLSPSFKQRSLRVSVPRLDAIPQYAERPVLARAGLDGALAPLWWSFRLPGARLR